MPRFSETFLAKIDPLEPDPQAMALAGQVILDGGLVAFPTETVYGLGANALNAEAVAMIFKSKGRPANDPIIVHIANLQQLEQIAQDIPPIVYDLAERFWPGALTVVLKKQPAIPDNVTAGQQTVAVRWPSHPVAQALIQIAGVPIAAPSANRFSQPSPTSALHVMHDLAGRVDVVLDGGVTHIGVESSIVDLTTPVPILLRPGGIPLEELRHVLPALAFRPRHISDDQAAPAPGTLARHYSPNAQVKVYAGERDVALNAIRQEVLRQNDTGQRVGILALDHDVLALEGVPAQYAMLGADIEAMAAQLFMGLRELDAAEVDVMLVRAPERDGLGLAVYDRLLRAAEGQIIEV